MELSRVLAIHLTILLSVASCTGLDNCCIKTEVFFYTVFDCKHFYAEDSGELCFYRNACHTGKRATQTNYCGVGKCNKFGCQCAGGCIGGNNSLLAAIELERNCRGLCKAVLNDHPHYERELFRSARMG